MPVNDTFLQELRYKTDILDTVSSYVSLKKRGSTYVGLCPFHNEKTPSFTVYPESQSFYCFGCGVGGDIITFVKKIENLDYVDAVRSLAQRAGLEMPSDGFDTTLLKKRLRLYEANRAAAKYYYSYLIGGDASNALDYYSKRRITLHTIRRFGLGYAPDMWDGLLKELTAQGFSVYELEQAGLVKRSSKNTYYDFFRNRAMTPIIDVRGNVIAFGGRVLDDSKPKYINTNDTLVYKKTNEVFGLNLAKDSGKEQLILCEGYMDVIAMNQAGFTNCVAGCGTALTEEQVKLISRYAKEVLLAYDNDDAGRKALDRAAAMFKKAGVKIKIPLLEYGKDPDEIIKNVGVEKFSAMLENAVNETEYSILRLRGEYDLTKTQGKIDFIAAVIPALAQAEPVERALYCSRLAQELELDANVIEAQLEEYIKRAESGKKWRERRAPITQTIKNDRRIELETGETPRLIKAAERLIYLLLKYQDCGSLAKSVGEEELPAGFHRKVFSEIISCIKNGNDCNLTSFSAVLSEDEMARLSGIIARLGPSDNPKAEFSDCVASIRSENNKKSKKSAGKLSDEEFRKLFSENQ